MVANMLLPSEVIDHIFSFLEGDIPALKECSNTHPLLSRLAERYLYADIVLTVDPVLISEFYERLSNNPHILQYPRTLEIQATATILPHLSVLSMAIIATIPRMTNLTTLKLSERSYYRVFFHQMFLSKLFEKYLQRSSIEQFDLDTFPDFPFSLLDRVKNIKKLTLIDSPPRPHQILQVETLIICGYLPDRLVRLPNLKSLQLPDVMRTLEWNAFPGLLTACSNSLTRLHFQVDDYGLMSPFLHTTLPYQEMLMYASDVIPSGRGYCPRLNAEFHFTFSTHKRLKHLSIITPVRTTRGTAVLVVSSAFSAIINLIKTAPAIQDIVLHLHWANSELSSLGIMDWSLLQSDFPGIRPRIHLIISGDTDGHSISPESILKVLTENEDLMDLVKRKQITHLQSMVYRAQVRNQL